jgi:hypothetical protein
MFIDELHHKYTCWHVIDVIILQQSSNSSIYRSGVLGWFAAPHGGNIRNYVWKLMGGGGGGWKNEIVSYYCREKS